MVPISYSRLHEQSHKMLIGTRNSSRVGPNNRHFQGVDIEDYTHAGVKNYELSVIVCCLESSTFQAGGCFCDEWRGGAMVGKRQQERKNCNIKSNAIRCSLTLKRKEHPLLLVDPG